MYHRPVLLEESLDGLSIQEGGTYIDLTYGGGGHSAGILERLGNGRLIAFDQDPEAEDQTLKDKRLLFIRGNFRYAKNYLRFHGIKTIDGALADLGVSSHQFDVAERGFSFRYDSEMDMRMNQDSEVKAADILKNYSEGELRDLFRRYGEVKNASRLASVICSSRQTQKLDTTTGFLEAIAECIPEKNRQKYLARVFQALRIEVNQEMESLKEMMEGVSGYMRKGSRFVVITYHSLEDRIVKNYFRSGNMDGELKKDFYGNVESPFKPVNRNVILPGAEELEQNPRARSAKLRIAEKTD
jgi:16S rRNA (cytosine1402-N4)-methyltransferase